MDENTVTLVLTADELELIRSLLDMRGLDERGQPVNMDHPFFNGFCHYDVENLKAVLDERVVS